MNELVDKSMVQNTTATQQSKKKKNRQHTLTASLVATSDSRIVFHSSPPSPAVLLHRLIACCLLLLLLIVLILAIVCRVCFCLLFRSYPDGLEDAQATSISFETQRREWTCGLPEVLSVRLSFHLPVRPSGCQSVCLSFCWPACLKFCLSDCLSSYRLWCAHFSLAGPRDA